jgi:hypothetical protein
MVNTFYDWLRTFESLATCLPLSLLCFEPFFERVVLAIYVEDNRGSHNKYPNIRLLSNSLRNYLVQLPGIRGSIDTRSGTIMGIETIFCDVNGSVSIDFILTGRVM